MALVLALQVGFSSIVLVMACTGVLLFLLNRQIPRLFVDDVVVIGIAAQLFCVAAVFQVVDGIQVMANSVLRALEDVRVPLGITTIAYWGIAIPSSVVFGQTLGWGVVGVWIGVSDHPALCDNRIPTR